MIGVPGSSADPVGASTCLLQIRDARLDPIAGMGSGQQTPVGAERGPQPANHNAEPLDRPLRLAIGPQIRVQNGIGHRGAAHRCKPHQQGPFQPSFDPHNTISDPDHRGSEYQNFHF